MRFNSFLVRDIALIFFAAVGICKAAGDLLALVFVEPSDNDYVQALILTVVMLAWKYFNKEKKLQCPKLKRKTLIWRNRESETEKIENAYSRL